MEAWATGALPASKKLLAHIDNCLLCRACEKSCPAAVPYGRIVDNFRALNHDKLHDSVAVSVLKAVSRHKSVNKLAQSALRFYQAAKLQKTVRKLKIPKLIGLENIEALLPDASQSVEIAAYYPATTEVKANVGLFIGCLGMLVDSQTIMAAIKLLTTAGFNVHIPESQQCCGALAAHGGDSKTAALLAEKNCDAFSDLPLNAIVSIASGCGSHLQEYNQQGFSGKVIDISQFLSKSSGFGEQLKPLNATVCLHTPCSLKNVMREEHGALNLLQQIPGIKITALPEASYCCGSAGSYVLGHTKMVKALLDDLLTAVLDSKPDYLVSSNIGCILHTAGGLRARGISIEVLHPVVLLARQLKE
jgi:glycolate oxidase iron-sulfur subunit